MCGPFHRRLLAWRKTVVSPTEDVGPAASLGAVFARGLLGLIILSTAGLAAAADELPAVSPPLPTELELDYLNILASWARGSQAAVGELSDLQQAWASGAAGFEISVASFPQLPTKVSSAGVSGPRPTSQVPIALSKRLPGIACLRELEERIRQQVVDLDPEGLLPLAYFYRRLYREQMGAPFRPWLAEHSRSRAFELSGDYRELVDPGAASRRAAVAMWMGMADTVLSASFFETGSEAREVYLRVLELDPDQAVARYWAAYLEEMLGRYGKAERHLEILSAQRPGDAEVALRLAVNRARSGRAAAAGALESLARGTGPDWIRIVAYQELGRLFAERDAERAVAYLRAAVASFPDNPRSHLQLAYLLGADWRAALTEVQRVEAGWSGDPGATPRQRYSMPRRGGIDRELQRLAGEVDRRKPILEQALTRLLLQRPKIDECAAEPPR